MNFPSVKSSAAEYSDSSIVTSYCYNFVQVKTDMASNTYIATPQKQHMKIKTEKRIPRLGIMLVGLCGNNGTTVVAGLLASKMNLSWKTKSATKTPNWYGSLMLSSTVKLGVDENGIPVFVPLSKLLPLCSVDSLVIGGWDLIDKKFGDAMRDAQVLDYTLQEQLYAEMNKIKPLPGVYSKSFIAENQEDRSNFYLKGTLQEKLNCLRQNIKTFKHDNQLDKVIVLWTGTTERFSILLPNIHDTHENLLQAIQNNHEEISPSTLYATAAILENCSYINGSPQNTFVPGLIELAHKHSVFIGGDDFKSGQTKMKSVIVDFLVSAGIKPVSIMSYNHLGNNDGKNLSSPAQFRSKEISKSTVIDDIISSNKILYSNQNNSPDHCVVIKYAPYVGDSKRAMDEYISEIFLGGVNTVVIHNTCEDSLLAAPIIIDLILLTELCQRISFSITSSSIDTKDTNQLDQSDFLYEPMHPVLSLLSYLCKAPLVPKGTPVINALYSQRCCITNFLLACLGLPPNSHIDFEHKIPSLIQKSINCNA